MDAAAPVFRLWRDRVEDFEKRLRHIALQPKEGQVLSALLLRNACINFIDQMAREVDCLVTEFDRDQSDKYQVAYEKFQSLKVEPKEWPFDRENENLVKLQKHELNDLATSLSKGSINFSMKVEAECLAINQRLTNIFTVLQNKYGVSLHVLKRK